MAGDRHIKIFIPIKNMKRTAEREAQLLIEKYKKKADALQSQIQNLKHQKDQILDIIAALEVVGQPVRPESKKRQSRMRYIKPQYRGYDYESLVLTVLKEHPLGMTMMDIAREVCLTDDAEATQAVYKSVRNTCIKQEHVYCKGDRYFLNKNLLKEQKVHDVAMATASLSPETLPLIANEPVPHIGQNDGSKSDQEEPLNPPTLDSKQADIFADMGEFTLKQCKKYYPQKVKT